MKAVHLQEWLEDPITRDFLSLVKEHRDAPYQMITESLINCSSVQDIDLTKIAEFRGQVHALDAIIDIETFMREKLNDDEELRSIGT